MRARVERPQVVAHRGASEDAAEHTLGAYLEALDAGAEGLECDVRLTADGHLVCFHDRDLRRTGQHARAGLHDGAGRARPARVRVVEEPLGRPRRRGARPRRGLDRVLTLRKLLETVADCDRRVELAIETKHPTRYGGLVERRLVEQLRHFGWHRPGSPARVMSFSYTALQRVQRLAPDVPLVMLIEKARHWPMHQAGRWSRAGSSARASTSSPSTPAFGRGWRAPAARSTSGPSTPTPSSSCASSWASRRSSPTGRRTCWTGSTDSLARMAKRSRKSQQPRERAEGPPARSGPRQPCPCGSGRRYKACHGAPGGAAAGLRRPALRGAAVRVRPRRAARAGAGGHRPAAAGRRPRRPGRHARARCCRWRRRRWCARTARSGWRCRCSTTSATRPATSARC